MPAACRHYDTQIAAYDIRTQRCDTYGAGDGYASQCFLVYDGLHYDALAVSAFEDAPEEVDCTVLSVDDSDLPQVRVTCGGHVRFVFRWWGRAVSLPPLKDRSKPQRQHVSLSTKLIFAS
jgi:hypothetical protein